MYIYITYFEFLRILNVIRDNWKLNIGNDFIVIQVRTPNREKYNRGFYIYIEENFIIYKILFLCE